MSVWRVGVVAAVGLAACVSGCDSDTGGKSRPKLPPITRPVDASAYASDDAICGLFTDQDAKAIGYRGKGVSFSMTTRVYSCSWQNPSKLQVSILENDYLATFYGGDSPVVGELTVSGQPAAKVLGDESGHVPIDEHCRIVVALKEHQDLDVSVNLGGGGHGACEQATKIATQVLHKLGA